MTELDARGLKCPLPVLRARKALKDVAPGAELRVLATDPSAVKDFTAFCAENGHVLVGWTENASVYTIALRKAG